MCFGEYGLAMKRKLAIAEYHYGELAGAPRQQDDQGLPPIPLQAHFEAAGRAVGSMPDQLASGIADLLEGAVPGLPPPSNAYLHTVRDALDEGSLKSLVADLTGASARYKGFAEQCMAEYNLDGWTAPDLVRSDDVSAIIKAVAPKG